MRLGVNFPWVTCGHDFGRRPPPWAGAPSTDWNAVQQDFRAHRALGMEVSRWWLMAAGVNYPVGEDPSRFRLRKTQLGEVYTLRGGELPPSLRGSGFVEDFAALCDAARSARVQLVPSLLSFEFFFPRTEQGPGVYTHGRGPLALGDQRGAGVSAFLNATLDPLLEVAARSPTAIRAFEVINEPGWSVQGGPVHIRNFAGRWRVMPKAVSAAAMSELLQQACERIAAAGLVATIGFKQGDPKWLSPSLRRTLRRLSKAGKYLHQAHHYPSLSEPHRLVPHEAQPFLPCALGEFPTARGPKVGLRHWRWRDSAALRRTENGSDYLLARLEHIESLGYPEAWLWSAKGTDEACAFGPAELDQIARFSAKERSPV